MKYRSQVGDDFEKLSDETSLVCSTETLVRQEEAAATELSYILARYGATPPPLAADTYVDYTMTLAEAYQTRDALQSWYDRLPQWVQTKYPSPDAVLAAAARGEVIGSQPPTGTTPSEKPSVSAEGTSEPSGSVTAS